MAITISEKDLEDLIFDDLSVNDGYNLCMKGLGIYTGSNQTPIRQVRLGGYGIADIITIGFEYDAIVVHILELKVIPLSLDHLIQLSRYIKAIKEIHDNSDIRRKLVIHGSLIVESIPMDKTVYIPHVLGENISIFSTQYGLDGVSFSKLKNTWQNGEGELKIKDSIPQETLLYIKDCFKSYYKGVIEVNSIQFDTDINNPF